MGEGFGEQGDMMVGTGKIWYEEGESWWLEAFSEMVGREGYLIVV